MGGLIPHSNAYSQQRAALPGNPPLLIMLHPFNSFDKNNPPDVAA
jgi:hypothetical protein